MHGQRQTIARRFSDTKTTRGAEVIYGTFTGKPGSTTFLNDYFFNSSTSGFLTQQRALILLHESVHQFGNKDDEVFQGSSNLSRLIAEKCFPALNALRLLGNLTF